MATDNPNTPVEGKFEETMRKSREKRADMKQQSERRLQAAEEALQREEAKRLIRTFPGVRESES
jgi:hypothetical protein